MQKTGLKAFVSYSHKDEALRAALDAHLSGMVAQGIIELWNDRAIEAGSEWEKEIDGRLEEADIVLLLISSDFLASPYCYGKEMRRAVERHERGDARVIPIIIRPVDWHHTPFAKLQALPKDGNPVTSWTNQDEALSNVAFGLRSVVASIRNTHEHGRDSDLAPSETVTVDGVMGIKATRVKQEMIAVTVEILSRGQAFECELPSDARVSAIVVELAKKLNAPVIELDGRPVVWDLVSTRLNCRLDSSKTLRQNNVHSGDILRFCQEMTAG